jgi:hypothetical protein
MKKELNIAHIINPVKVSEGSDLYKAQPITFETMDIAARYAGNAGKKIKIRQYAAFFAEDEGMVPSHLRKTPLLDRSIPDLGQFELFRKLPLLKDILDRLYHEATDADYLIYTNADIGFVPHFYESVAAIVMNGYDAFVINRRTIPADANGIEDIPLMWAQAGETHIGHDCFIFKREAYPRFRLGNVGIGIRLVGRVLLWNLVAQATGFKEFKDLHLTFHLGQDKPWKNSRFKDYDRHNHAEAVEVLKALDRENNLIATLEDKYPDYLVAVTIPGE